MNKLSIVSIMAFLSFAAISSIKPMELEKASPDQGYVATLEEQKVDEQIEYLLGQIADINQEINFNGEYFTDGRGQRLIKIQKSHQESTTLLAVAVEKGSLNMVRTLIKQGATVDSDLGMIAIRRAQDHPKNGDTNTGLAILRELLKHNGNTAELLAVAASEHDLGIVKMLVEEYNVKVTDTDIARASCYLYGKQPDSRILIYLFDRCEHAKNVLAKFDISRQPDTAVLELLLQLGVTVDATGTNEETYLFKAIRNSDDETVELLIKYGADVNKASKNSVPLDLVHDLIKNPELCVISDPEKLIKIKKVLEDNGALSKNGHSPRKRRGTFGRIVGAVLNK